MRWETDTGRQGKLKSEKRERLRERERRRAERKRQSVVGSESDRVLKHRQTHIAHVYKPTNAHENLNSPLKTCV